MAVPALNGPNGEKNSSPQAPAKELTGLQLHVARLYGVGLRRPEIAKALMDYLAPGLVDRKIKLQRARNRLRRWEQNQQFRDEVYLRAVVEVDMDTPNILKAISRKAQRGRVDAARLALELTGRHNPRGEQGAAQVVVAINGIPRPQMEAIEVEAREIEDGDS